MKVVVLALGYPVDPAKPSGGLEAAVHSQVDALFRYAKDIQLHVLVCPSSRDGILSPGPGRPCAVEYFRGDGPLRDLLPKSPVRQRIANRIQEIHPDLVHVHGGPQFMDGSRFPSVLTIHGLAERDTMFRHARGAKLRGWLTRRLHRPHRMRYANVIALSGQLRIQLHSEFRGRFHFIPNSISESFFEISRPVTEPVALFIGAVTPLKNAHSLLRAMGLLKRAGVIGGLRIAGSLADSDYVQKIREIIREEDIADSVALLGPLSRQELERELSSARCVVHPSFQENAPMAIAEASAAGVPCVASAVGGIPEMVAHQISGWLVDPESPASIAAGLRVLFEDRVRADEWGAIARQRAGVHHPRHVAEELHSVYAEIMGQPG